jgi:GT2 family glycosyltransferase
MRLCSVATRQPEGQAVRCDIVIATWNAVPMTRTALTSVRDKSGFPYRLVLVDNSDEEEARAYYRAIAASSEFGDTVLIQNDGNLGWLKATNLGLEAAEGEYVCLLNNDVVCGEGWLARCIDLIRREPEIGLVNPRGNERRENAGVSDVNAYARHLATSQRSLYTERAHCSGFCMVMPIRLVKEIGLLDEIFEQGYYEDNDFSYRARALGYRCAQCDDAFVLHLGSQSFKKIPSEQKRLMIERNRKICESRWGKVHRQLLLVNAPDVGADELIAQIRQNRTYLINSRYVPEEVRIFRHQNLQLLSPGPLGKTIGFYWYSFYLSFKKRIDEARIVYK